MFSNGLFHEIKRNHLNATRFRCAKGLGALAKLMAQSFLVLKDSVHFVLRRLG